MRHIETFETIREFDETLTSQKNIIYMKIYIYIHICFLDASLPYLLFPRYYFTMLFNHYLNHFFRKQFISIVINLLDALKTSFSHRSLTARSMGRRDTVSEAAVASISMLKVTSILEISSLFFLPFQLVNKFICYFLFSGLHEVSEIV